METIILIQPKAKEFSTSKRYIDTSLSNPYLYYIVPQELYENEDKLVVRHYDQNGNLIMNSDIEIFFIHIDTAYKFLKEITSFEFSHIFLF